MVNSKKHIQADIDRASHSTELNGSDEWVHLLPSGTFSGRDGRGPYVLNSSEDVIAKSSRIAGNSDLVVDYEHQTDFSIKNGKPAPAAGWIKELEARHNGIWGRIEWTKKAADMIASKEYRYLSPVFKFNRITGDIGHLLNASLTNVPNLELTALNRKQGDPIMDELLKRLAGIFGLSEDADQTAIVNYAKKLTSDSAAHSTSIGKIAEAVSLDKQVGADEIVKALNSRAASTDEPDPRKYVPIKAVEEMQTSLNRIISDRTEEKAVSAVNSAVESGKLQPALKDWGTALHKKDPQAFEDYISKQTGSIAGEDAPSGSPEKGEKSLTDEQKAICSSMGVSEEDYISNLETEENV